MNKLVFFKVFYTLFYLEICSILNVKKRLILIMEVEVCHQKNYYT